MFFGIINSLEYIKIHENDQKPLFWPFFGQKWQKISKFWPFLFSRILTKQGSIYMFFVMINSLECIKLHENDQELFFWAIFDQKWQKMSKMSKIQPFFSRILTKQWSIYMFFVVINLLEYIKIHENDQKSLFGHFLTKTAKNLKMFANFFFRF